MADFAVNPTNLEALEPFPCAFDISDDGSRIRFAHVTRLKWFKFQIFVDDAPVLTLLELPTAMAFIEDMLVVTAHELMLYAVDLRNGAATSLRQTCYSMLCYNRHLKFALLGGQECCGAWEVWQPERLLQTRSLDATSFETRRSVLPYADTVHFSADGKLATCTRARCIFVVDCATGRELRQVACGRELCGKAVALDPNTFVVAAQKTLCAVDTAGEDTLADSLPFSNPSIVAASDTALYVRERSSIVQVVVWPCRSRKRFLQLVVAV